MYVCMYVHVYICTSILIPYSVHKLFTYVCAHMKVVQVIEVWLNSIIVQQMQQQQYIVQKFFQVHCKDACMICNLIGLLNQRFSMKIANPAFRSFSINKNYKGKVFCSQEKKTAGFLFNMKWSIFGIIFLLDFYFIS